MTGSLRYWFPGINLKLFNWSASDPLMLRVVYALSFLLKLTFMWLGLVILGIWFYLVTPAARLLIFSLYETLPLFAIQRVKVFFFFLDNSRVGAGFSECNGMQSWMFKVNRAAYTTPRGSNIEEENRGGVWNPYCQMSLWENVQYSIAEWVLKIRK